MVPTRLTALAASRFTSWQSTGEPARRGDACPPIYYPGTFSRKDAKLITFDKEKSSDNVNITLRKGGGLILEGTVRDEAGKPVPEAFVVVDRRDMLFDFVTAYTDEQGRYQIQGLGEGEFTVHVDAVHRGFVRMRIPLDLDKASEKTRRDFTLARGVAISGKLVDEKGKDWRIGESFGYANVIKDKPDKSDSSSFSLTHFWNKYRPENVAPYLGGFFALGEGGYRNGDMHFPTKSTFVIQGMMPGNTTIGFLPNKERQKVLKILYGGRDILKSGVETKPGEEIKNVTIVIGTATEEESKAESKPAPIHGLTTEPNLEQAKAIAEIENLGGKVEVLHASPGKPYIRVVLVGTKATDTALASLKALPEVQLLVLERSNVSDAGLERLEGLTMLQGLFLSNTKVTDAGLEHLKGLKRLRGLVLSNTKVTGDGLVHLKGLPQLSTLDLSYTQLTDAGMASLRGLTRLGWLDLRGNKVTDTGLECLKGLTQLGELNLAETQVTDTGIEHLKGLTKLQHLILESTSVSDAGLEHLKGLTKLEMLDLTGSKVSDAGLKHLNGLTRLRTLRLWDTQVTDSGVNKLQQALPNCKIDYKPADEHPAPAAPKANDPAAETSAASPAKSSTAVEKTGAKPADKASTDKEGLRGELPLTTTKYHRLRWLDVRRHYGIDGDQEKKLREYSAAFEPVLANLDKAAKEAEKLPPQTRKAKLEELSRQFQQVAETTRKRIEEVLTAKQRAEYHLDDLCEAAIVLCRDPDKEGNLLGLDLSQQQKQQLKQLEHDLFLATRRREAQENERLLAVLTPEQRERLSAKYADPKIATPFVNFLQPNVYSHLRKVDPSPLDFNFRSRGGAIVGVSGALWSEDVRKQMGLSAEQTTKLKEIWAESKAAAQQIFDSHEPKDAPRKLSADEEQVRQAEYRQKLEALGKDIMRQIDGTLSPAQRQTMMYILRRARSAARSKPCVEGRGSRRPAGQRRATGETPRNLQRGSAEVSDTGPRHWRKGDGHSHARTAQEAG